MTLPSDSPYLIARLKTLLSERVGIDLSPIELAEILWLVLQKGEVVAENRPPGRSQESLPAETEAPLPLYQWAEGQVAPPTAAVVTGPSKSTRGSQEAGTALPINIPEAVALRNRRQIARSLRPLMRKVPSKLRQAIDEESTVIQIAETQIWNPVVKPEPERWLELAIVIEVTNLLDVWRDTIGEFRQLMERHGAFRDVRTWQLKPNSAGDPQLFLQTAKGLQSNARSPRELLDASGRRLILLLSDCTSRAWRSGKLPKLLELWSRENPVTIVQLLPEHYWDRSALKSGYPVALRSRLPGALSRDWVIEGLSPQRRQRLPGGLRLPVVTMQPESLGEWARAIAAIGEQRTTGIMLGSQAFQTNDSVSLTATSLTAKQLVQRFRGTASAKAQELADMMAVLPVNWSVIRLIQKNLVERTADSSQETGALYLAEIFLSGLLCPVPMEAGQTQKRGGVQQYDFADGVRDVLLGTIPRSEAQQVGEEIAEAVFKQLPPAVQERVSADIERRFGESLSYFEAFLIPDLPWGENAAAEILPFARVTGQVLRRWGGDYAALAEELERSSLIYPSQHISITQDLVVATFNQRQDEILDQIAEAFSNQDHDFQLTQHPSEQVEVVDEITLDTDRQLYVGIVQHTLKSIETDAEGIYALFELSVRIGFAAKIYYVDFENYHSVINDSPRLEQVVINQTVDAIAEINLWFPEQNPDKVEVELLELRVEEPILIDETQTDAFASIPVPALQTFEFEVATIAFESLPNSLQVTKKIPRILTFGFEVATIAFRTQVRPVAATRPIYVLHLSDLHFGTPVQANLWSSQLADDLRELNLSHLDALILSGDIANRSTPEEYAAAQQFLAEFRQDFPLKPEQIIIVPGNHDLNWTISEEGYEPRLRKTHKGLTDENHVIDDGGNYIAVINPEQYQRRFQPFSQFYQAIKGEAYPIDPEQQYTIDRLNDHLLILGLNSAWQLDHHYRNRVSINGKALTNALREINRTPDYQNCPIKIAVWHHPIHSARDDRIKDSNFMERLSVNGFRFFLHGHIYQGQKGFYDYDSERGLFRICAGTFGAPTHELTTAMPWQYHLLKFADNQLTIQSRKRASETGAWESDYCWRYPKNEKRDTYQIDLIPSTIPNPQ